MTIPSPTRACVTGIALVLGLATIGVADAGPRRTAGAQVPRSYPASSTGVHLAAGSGTWSSLSDRNAKTDIVPLDGDSILAKVASLPIGAWQ